MCNQVLQSMSPTSLRIYPKVMLKVVFNTVVEIRQKCIGQDLFLKLALFHLNWPFEGRKFIRKIEFLLIGVKTARMSH